MPFGLFSKKSKAPSNSGHEVARVATRSSIEADLVSVSTTLEYVHAEKGLPSSPNGRTGLRQSPAQSSVYPNAVASSSKLKLPFSRKKASSTAASTSTTSLATTNGGLSPPTRPPAGRKSFSAGTDVSQLDSQRLGPPPSRSAIFAAYADPNSANSTRSLPNDTSPPHSDGQSQSAAPKKHGLFHWSKSTPNTRQKRPPEHQAETSNAPEDGAFNLKAFRHVGPSPSPSQAQPSPSPTQSTSSLVPPVRPRIRNNSGASDSSQRISVAAFREAQARRSLAGSPIPSMRSPSPGPMLPTHRPMNTPSPVHTRSPPLPLPQTGRGGFVNRSAISPSNPAFGRKSTAYSTTTDSDESSSEESSGEDVGLRRGGTVTQRGPADSKQSSSASPSPVAPVISSKASSPPTRASHRPTPSPVTRRTLRTNDSETDSSDDEPLAALVPPRRPASSASGASSRSGGGRPRPLLEINEITSRPPMVGRKTSDTDDAFTQGRTLLSTKPAVSRSPPVRSPLTPVTSSEPPAPFVSPPPSPVKPSHTPLKDAPLPPPPNESFQRMSPMRRSTAETAPSSSPVSEKPRDALAERLHRMVIQDAVRSSSPESLSSASSSPRAGDVAAGNPGQHGTGRAEIKRESTGTITPANHLRRGSSGAVPTTSPAAAQGGDLDADLINLLGGGIRLISKEGEDVDVPAPTLDTIAAPIAQPAPARATRAFGVAAGKRRVIPDEDSDEETSSSESDDDDDKDSDSDARRPAPIPIARRTPPPAFRVTSRPHAQEQSQIAQRPRSSTLHETPSPIVLDSPGKPNMPLPRKQQTANGGPVRVRPRSTSLNPSTAMLSSAPPVAFPPRKPFASSSRTESPASSTGDSSSGIAPLTPQDGSDVSSGIAPAAGRPSQGWGSGVSGLGMGAAKGKHKKSRSVSFESDIQDRNELQQSTQTDDFRRNERRRNEAKAAIELGNVMNGRGPVLPDEETPQAANFDPRMSMMNPMMMNMPMQFPTPAGGSWNMWQNGQMLNPQQFMVPLPSDPAMYAAHQRAMMYAKQAYQMAAAQQAMAAAAEEWERSSNASAFGSGGSVIGGVGGMNSMRSSMMMQNWNAGGMMFPGAPRSMYFGSAQSEFGGGSMGVGGFSSAQSVYGESFGPAKGRNSGVGRSGGAARDSQQFPAPPPIPQSGSSRSLQQQQQQRQRTSSQPANPRPGAGVRRAPPPSSWKPSH